jgi:hypothetical protein
MAYLFVSFHFMQRICKRHSLNKTDSLCYSPISDIKAVFTINMRSLMLDCGVFGFSFPRLAYLMFHITILSCKWYPKISNYQPAAQTGSLTVIYIT